MFVTRPTAPFGALSLLLALLALRAAWSGPDLRPPQPVATPSRAPVTHREPRRIDPNHASLPELEALPRVGPALAARIVAARPFARVAELERVRGIGPATLAQLRPLLRIGDESASVEKDTGASRSSFASDAGSR